MKIDILDYPLYLRLGIFSEEQASGHEALVSVSIDLPDKIKAGQHDDIDLTVNYSEVIKLLNDEVAGREFQLIEAVVDRIGAVILESFAIVESVTVCVEKRVFARLDVKGARIKITQEYGRA